MTAIDTFATAPVALVALDDPTVTTAPLDRLSIGFATRPLDERGRGLARNLDLTLVPMDLATAPQFVGVADSVAESLELRATATANSRASAVLSQVLRAALPDTATALQLESFAYSTLLGGTEFAHWLAERGRRETPAPPAHPVLVDRRGDTLHITLNDPNRRNAYSRYLRDALVEALTLPGVDHSISRIVLDGAGPLFCAGGDLDEFGTTPDPVTAHFVRTQAGAALLLHQLADRTEFRVHGSCIGAGIELPAFASRIVARPGTTFRLPEVGMGLIPGAGGTVSIARRVGRWRTFYLALTGKALDASTAMSWGLVDSIQSTFPDWY
ncbi:MAG TPA: enoyl-CoA hydratase/isomerase family protein [Pseudonocardiaceae bacterium]|jgi:hypothetical protein|nr:enoyl-CoA hydratase/isomerase family protein [Pseudonocardiaceae bacterium]